MAQFLTSVSGTGIQYSLAGSNDGVVMPGVTITSTTDYAVALTGGNQSLAVLGVLGGNLAGVSLGYTVADPGTQTLTVGSTGQVIGGTDGVRTFGPRKQIINNGDIVGTFTDGIVGTGLASETLVVKNIGTISGGENGISTSGLAAYVANSGTIIGRAAALNFIGTNGDTLYNRGSLIGNVLLGGGANLLYNYGEVTGDVSAGTGADKLINAKGSINGAVNLGDGDNVLRNLGDMGGNIAFGTSQDLLVNQLGGEIHGDITMGGSSGISGDQLFNRGLITGQITFGSSRDVFSNRGGIVDGRVFMGIGDDIFDNRGGTFRSSVFLEGGADTYILGLGEQRVDGGADVDTLDFSRGGGIVFRTDSSSGQLGLPADSVFTNFENVKGSYTGSNTITGDSGANSFFGGRSVDKLYGGGGSDYLAGGDGNDFLFGGAGKDVMEGGTGADTFLFAAGESTLVLQDEIYGFSKAERDIINLASIDAIASSSNDQAFTFIGTAAFTNVAGQLRFRPGLAGGATSATIIEGDTNGDGTADVAIALLGTVVLAATDFVL